MTYKGAPLMSVNQTWGTPKAFFEYLYEEFNWIPWLDAAASKENAKAPVFFTEKQNSLELDWLGDVWLNPPFGKVLLPKFLQKCNEEIYKQDVDSIMCLIPARTDTKWFHEIVLKTAPDIYLIKGRFNFESPYSKDGANAPFPSMLVHYHGKKRYEMKSIIEPLIVPKEYRGWRK